MFDTVSSPNLLPIKMCAAVVTLDQYAPDWTLAENSHELESREFVTHILFDAPFSNTPIVHIGLSGFDIDQRDSARISVQATAITSTGFDMRIKSWQNTRVYKVEASWIAMGQA